MGIPAAFRWLSQKYPKILESVKEEKPREIDGRTIPVDTTKPNPNGEEFDNLYLDMNGIVHPCSHPEDRPAPATEADMMMAVFEYTDRVVNMVRPRKLLMIAIDGVAPRAKMNQQRSRRFRSAQEAREKDKDKEEHIKMLKAQNNGVLSEEMQKEMSKKTWDSNAITPGTPFMDILASSLRYWVAYKINRDPAWEKLKVIISDASVPGEGEHKIMEFIRSQRSSPDHDPNTRHVMYGLDADLIMLGLATHEPNFRILREDVFFQEGKARTCRICGQTGHLAAECRGEAKVKQGENDEKGAVPTQKPFIWLKVNVLREYLAIEMHPPNQPFKFDIERALDDWIFMCFFVGNDFLPHLPALDIRDQGIDILIAIWRDSLSLMGGYLTKDGFVDLERAQCILSGLAKQEDAIFKRRKQTEDRKKASHKRRLEHEERRKRPRRSGDEFKDGAPQGLINLDDLRDNTKSYRDGNLGQPETITHDMVVNRNSVEAANNANKSAAAVLKERLAAKTSAPTEIAQDSSLPVEATDPTQTPDESSTPTNKRKRDAEELEGNDAADATAPAAVDGDGKADEEEAAPEDTIRLWEDGYGDRYYEQKFGVSKDDIAFRNEVARKYIEGLAWVLLYYFQGCPSWTWYYPYHYAPFAADFVNIGSLKLDFRKGEPFKPFEQLMGVMPAASNHTIPDVFHSLMTDEDSPIVEFYPEEFPIDLNGKKFAWQGVAILPFIDEKKLLDAMAEKYPLLSEEQHARNARGRDALFFHENHPMYEGLAANFFAKKKGIDTYVLNPRTSEGLSGKVDRNERFIPNTTLEFPLPSGSLPDIAADRSITVHYDMPKKQGSHKSMLLRGAKLPEPALLYEDVQNARDRAMNTGRSFMGAPLVHGNYHGRHNNRGSGGNRNHHGNHRGNDRSNPFAAHLGPAMLAQAMQGAPPPMQASGPYPQANGQFQPPPPGAPFGQGMPQAPNYGGSYGGNQMPNYDPRSRGPPGGNRGHGNHGNSNGHGRRHGHRGRH